MPITGLVFAGGGGKGAYQIGVWRAMRDLGIDREIRVVSGTSVGALNAALFAQGDFTAAETVWKELSPEQILFAPPKDAKDFAKGLLSPRNLLLYALPTANLTLASLTPKIMVSRFSYPLLLRLGRSFLPSLTLQLSSGIITNKGLQGMIDKAVDFNQIAASPVRCCATCCRLFPGFPLDRIYLGEHDAKYDRSVLLASAAIPFVFPAVRLGKRFYCDGGVPKIGDNTPIEPAYMAGCREIIVVHLANDPPAHPPFFRNAKIIHIVPSESLGGYAATLDFTGEGARGRLELGYHDALAILKSHV